jgi:choline dehydrogenase-like flavoprotein
MLLDAARASDQTTLDADVCIIGGGVTGLALAAELASRPVTVVVVESGSDRLDPAAQLLNSAVVEGDAHAGLTTSRHRQVGGSSHLWNTLVRGSSFAKYVPLDPLDFRGERGRPDWPIGYVDIEPFYLRAQTLAGLGRFDYKPSGWNLPNSPIPNDHPVVESRVYQVGPRSRFCEHLPNIVRLAENITLCQSATAVGLRWQDQEVVGVDAVGRSGSRLAVNARSFVLAGGGVENARMLLVEARAGRLRDESGWLGRGFMEHPRDHTMIISSTSQQLFRRLEFFDTKRNDGSFVAGRMALREEAVTGHDLLNASVSILPVGPHIRPFHWRVDALAKRFGWAAQWPPGYGWSLLPGPIRRFRGFQLVINLEEFPSADNRLVLDAETDHLGVPRVRLLRKWQCADAARLDRLRTMLSRSLADMGLGPVHMAAATIPNPDSHHHLGLTRMGRDSKSGVTDQYGRVFGAANLFVTGPSTFPSGGWANPTLTSIALAIRLADQLIPQPSSPLVGIRRPRQDRI